MNNIELLFKARQIRRKCVEIVSVSKASHIGSMLSMTDLLVYLFYEEMNFTKQNYRLASRDRFVLSKGHASLALYTILQDKKIIGLDKLASYCANNGCLMGHLDKKVEGVDVSTGSLGHGLSMSAGLALAYKMDKSDNKVYCLVGDGECDEGSIWEALIFISNHDLHNLVIIVDANKLQGYDFNENIFQESKLIGMLKNTGINFYEIDGHDFSEIRKTFKKINSQKKKGMNNSKAHLVFAHTIKGKGVSFMENRLEWHYKSPDEEQLKKALEELN